MKKGDLIRIKPSADYLDGDFEREEGSLYVVSRPFESGSRTVWAKSLVTGSEFVWFPEEYEHADQD